MTAAAALEEYRNWHGKIEVVNRVEIDSPAKLAKVYTPGVAAPCKEIAREPDLSFDYTRRGNLVAVVTDGSAVLGLGDIGPEAGMPVMEGKAALLKSQANVDGFPLCIKSEKTDDIVRTVELLSGTFGAIHLEDISAPRCFEIEARLRETLDIPVYHDDQHGTAVAAAAALLGACRVTGRDLANARIVILGAGASGISVADLLLALGATDVILVDREGIVGEKSPQCTDYTRSVVCRTNPRGVEGGLAQAATAADVLIGVSEADAIDAEVVGSMAPKAIVFALANPTPEIMPQEAKDAGAAVVATGRSDFPNQVNNLLAFPGIFRGALDARATEINDAMLVAAVRALVALAAPTLDADHIVPAALDPQVAPAVASAVAAAAAFAQVGPQDEVLVLSDILQGSVNQAFVPYLGEHVFIVAGVNVACCLELALSAEPLTCEFIEQTIDQARNAMVLLNTYAVEAEEDDE